MTTTPSAGFADFFSISADAKSITTRVPLITGDKTKVSSTYVIQLVKGNFPKDAIERGDEKIFKETDTELGIVVQPISRDQIMHRIQLPAGVYARYKAISHTYKQDGTLGNERKNSWRYVFVGKNLTKSNATTPLTQAISIVKSLYTKRMTQVTANKIPIKYHEKLGRNVNTKEHVEAVIAKFTGQILVQSKLNGNSVVVTFVRADSASDDAKKTTAALAVKFFSRTGKEYNNRAIDLIAAELLKLFPQAQPGLVMFGELVNQNYGFGATLDAVKQSKSQLNAIASLTRNSKTTSGLAIIMYSMTMVKSEENPKMVFAIENNGKQINVAISDESKLATSAAICNYYASMYAGYGPTSDDIENAEKKDYVPSWKSDIATSQKRLVRFARTMVCEDVECIMQYFDYVIEIGDEGLVIKDSAHYHINKTSPASSSQSSKMVKMKAVDDDEFVAVGYELAKDGRLVLKLKTDEGNEFLANIKNMTVEESTQLAERFKQDPNAFDEVYGKYKLRVEYRGKTTTNNLPQHAQVIGTRENMD
jgi:hypothetical protein